MSPDELYAAVARLARPRTYDETIHLGRMRALMSAVGNPEDGLTVLHVGGTAGKGSTCMFAASVLRAAGARVGLYTKPHMHDLTERFRVDGRPIAVPDLLARVDAIAAACREADPTWFEAVTALAIQYFADQHVDVAVIEVGMGGETDATNITHPKASVLTNVGSDHLAQLGGSLESAAREKAAIARAGVPISSGVVQPHLRTIAREVAAGARAPYLQLGEDIVVTDPRVHRAGSEFGLRTAGRTFHGLEVRTLGLHQTDNAALAVSACLTLESSEFGPSIDDASVRAGLASTETPGRAEVFSVEGLTVVLDGAHSEPKMEALAATLDAAFPGETFVGVLALPPDRDPEPTLRPLVGALRLVIVCDYTNRNEFGAVTGHSPDRLRAAVVALRPDLACRRAASVHEAWNMALSAAREDSAPIVATGSFSVVAALRTQISATEMV